MRKLTLIILSFVLFVFFSCDKNEDNKTVFMGIAYDGQSIPVNKKYSFTEGTYTASVSFIDENSYTWSQNDVQGNMSMVVPCDYNAVTGEFSDTTIADNGTDEYGSIQSYPVSFVIDDMKMLFLHTYSFQRDTALLYPLIVVEKKVGKAGTLVGTYEGSFYLDNWMSGDAGMADMKIEATVTLTYTENTFTGTYSTHTISESTISIPEYGIEAGTSEKTETTAFSGTWSYDEATNTITETISVPETITNTYTPYWVTFNGKLYLATSLTRCYQ